VSSAHLHIGIIVNPLAGLGGSLARKGSDGEKLRALASRMSAEDRQRSQRRLQRALAPLCELGGQVCYSTWGGDMGENALRELHIPAQVLGAAGNAMPRPDDTRRAAAAMRDAGVDILVFAGGDGTASDIYDAVGETLPVLGVPAGVKMHSGVFAVSPEAAGELLSTLVRGGLVGVTLQEVRDIDEEAFRRDQVRSRFYGELLVPGEGRFLQHTKIGGRESQELVAADIAAWVVETTPADTLCLVGPGSTTAALMAEWGLDNTLLGVDAVCGGQLLLSDADEQALLYLLSEWTGDVLLFVTVIGGQGYIFGRGNQQFSPAVLRAVGKDNIRVLAAKSKLTALEGRPLLVDTNDPQLDRELCGYCSVQTGYDDRVLYRIATMEDQEKGEL